MFLKYFLLAVLVAFAIQDVAEARRRKGHKGRYPRAAVHLDSEDSDDPDWTPGSEDLNPEYEPYEYDSQYSSDDDDDDDNSHTRHRRSVNTVQADKQAYGRRETIAKTRLMDDLFKKQGYGRNVIPESNTTVQLAVTYLCARLDRQTRTLTSKAWLFMEWNDYRLTWDPQDYDGVETIRYPYYRMWYPDILMFHNLEREEREFTNANVKYDGRIILVAPTTYKTPCKPDTNGNRAYNCQFKLGSWTYDANILPITTRGEGSGFDTTYYLDACPYTVRNATSRINTKKYDCCPEPYQSLDINFVIEPSE